MPPLLSRAVDNGREDEAQTMLNYTVKGFLLIAISFVAGSYILSEPLLTLFANAEVAANTVLVTPIVAIGILFYGLTIILNNIFFVQMKTKVMFKVSFAAAILNVVLNLIFLYFFRNVVVAAVTTMVSYFAVFVFAYKTVKKDWPVDFQPVTILKSVTASLSMAALLFWVSFKTEEVNSAAMLVGEVALGIVAYVGGLLILGTFSKKELQFVKSCVCR